VTAKANLVGHRFGRLTVVASAPSSAQGRARWRCHCDCGAESVVLGKKLLSGTQKSCGCFRAEVLRSAGAANVSHGHARAEASPTYRTWKSMLSRCTNPNATAFPRYGGRGVAVCARWEVFENFLADMGERPAGTTLDRFPNRAGNYEPDNCRWATPTEQARNRSSSRPLTVAGVTLTIAEWAERRGLRPSTIHERLRRGWSAADALGFDKGAATT
jgi:hypothetical protein